MAAELRLNVSLDLGFFRQQLQKLTVVAQSEFTPKLNVKFNRSTLDKELNNLQSAIKRRVYRIEIGGNIDAFPDKIASIRRELAALETQKEIKIPITVENGVTKKDSSAVVASIRRSIREDALEDTGNKIRIPVSITPSITQKDVADFKKAVKESLGGISIDVKAKVKGGGFAGSSEGAAGLMEFMRTQGMVGKTASGMEMRMRNEPGAGKIQRTALDQLARAILFMAGIDPAQIRQAQAERRRIPNIDFNPTVPPRSFSIGPSSTGRALPPGAIAKGLPGTAFGAQKYLPTALGEELKQILRGAANAFVDAVKQNIRAVKITDLGAPVSRQGLLGGRTTAGFLPAGIGRVPGTYSTGRLGREGETREQLFARREREARMRSALRGVDIMGAGPSRIPAPYSQSYRAARPTSAIVPYAAPGALVAQGGGAPPSRGTGGPFGGRPGGPGGMQFNIPNLPGSGIVRELGEEFGFAAKQVLLFGTAYKALAFIQTFPAQVGEAVGALQSFRNTIGEISPTAKEAAASSQFILDIVDKYNVPLQSARDGFVKLYASMQPAGFSGDEIRDLFLGISQTAATFGMSADKVDRVNYAFAQMASKGQVMSEELKGQLGDVLPGAMAIFAEAAGFKGPEAISKFSEALEDGVYKAGAMKTLLTNVGGIMRQEFGPGAEGAARTFQGVMNRMQNSTKLLYESFEPVAVGFLNAVVMPMTNGIKTITDGFNAFFTGTAAQTSGGFTFAKELEKLRPSFEGIAQNVRQLLPVLQSFGNTLLAIGKTFIAIAGNPFTGFLLRAYAAVLPLTAAIRILNLQALVPLIASLFRAVPAFIAFTVASARGATVLQAVRVAMASTGQTGVVAAGQIRLFSTTLKAAFASTVIGLVVLGIGMIIERMMSLGARMDEVRSKAMGAAQAIRGMSQVEARIAGQQAQRDIKLIEDVSKRKPTKGTKGQIPVTAEEVAALERGGVVPQLSRKALPGAERRVVNVTDIPVARQERESIVQESEYRIRQLKSEEQQGMQPVALAPITGAGAETGTGKDVKEKKERESQIPQLTLQLEKTRELSGIEMQIVNAQLMNNDSQLNSLELVKKLVEFKYEAKGLALEDLTAEERSLKMKEIGLRREQAILESQLQLQINLSKERGEIQKEFETMLGGYQEEADFQQRYLDLINQGILPSMAKARVEGEKAFVQAEKKLDSSMEQIEANIAVLEVTIEALKLEGKLTEEKQKQLEAAENNLKTFKEELRLRGLLKGTEPERKAAAITAAEKTLAPKTAQEYIGEGLEEAQKNLERLMNTGYQVVEAANAIGDAFGTAFKGILTGSMTAQEAFAGMFQSIADHFADMVAKMIAEYLKAQVIKGFQSLIGMIIPGIGGGGASTGFGSGFDQYGGGNFGGGGNVTGFFGANGGVASGGFKPFPVAAFANGGMVTGPTLGLVGEGRYSEAIVPLPDGRSIPVEMTGGGASNINVTVNVDAKGTKTEGDENQGKVLGGLISAAVQSEIIKQQRPGGLLTRN